MCSPEFCHTAAEAAEDLALRNIKYVADHTELCLYFLTSLYDLLRTAPADCGSCLSMEPDRDLAVDLQSAQIWPTHVGDQVEANTLRFRRPCGNEATLA